MLPVRRQDTTWTYTVLLSVRPLGTNTSEIRIEIENGTGMHCTSEQHGPLTSRRLRAAAYISLCFHDAWIILVLILPSIFRGRLDGIREFVHYTNVIITLDEFLLQVKRLCLDYVYTDILCMWKGCLYTATQAVVEESCRVEQMCLSSDSHYTFIWYVCPCWCKYLIYIRTNIKASDLEESVEGLSYIVFYFQVRNYIWWKSLEQVRYGAFHKICSRICFVIVE